MARGDAPGPDAMIDTDPPTFAALVTHRLPLRVAVDRDLVTVTGDVIAFERLPGALNGS